MIDIGRACDIIQEHFPRAEPKSIYMYKKKFYLIVAPSGEDDSNDPFYIVDVANGDYRFINPTEDIDAFNESIERGPIKTIS